MILPKMKTKSILRLWEKNPSSFDWSDFIYITKEYFDKTGISGSLTISELKTIAPQVDWVEKLKGFKESGLVELEKSGKQVIVKII